MSQPPHRRSKLAAWSCCLLAFAATACGTVGGFQPPTEPPRAVAPQRSYADEAAPGPYWADGVPPSTALATNARLAVDLESGRTEFIPGAGWHQRYRHRGER